MAASWRRDRAGVVAAVVHGAEEGAQVVVVALEAGRADDVEQRRGLGDVGRAVGGDRAQELAVGAQRGLAAPAAAGARHDRGQRQDALGAPGGDRLGDHAAHRDADEVGALDAEVVEQADAVGGHLGQRVGGGALVAAR